MCRACSPRQSGFCVLVSRSVLDFEAVCRRGGGMGCLIRPGAARCSTPNASVLMPGSCGWTSTACGEALQLWTSAGRARRWRISSSRRAVSHRYLNVISSHQCLASQRHTTTSPAMIISRHQLSINSSHQCFPAMISPLSHKSSVKSVSVISAISHQDYHTGARPVAPVPCTIGPVHLSSIAISRQYLASISPVPHHPHYLTSVSRASQQYPLISISSSPRQYLTVASTRVSHHDFRSLLITLSHYRPGAAPGSGAPAGRVPVRPGLPPVGQRRGHVAGHDRPGAADGCICFSSCVRTAWRRRAADACLRATDHSRCTRALLSARWPGQAPARRRPRATPWRRFGRASTSPRRAATGGGAGISLILSLSICCMAAYASAVACERPGAAELQTLACVPQTTADAHCSRYLTFIWPQVAVARDPQGQRELAGARGERVGGARVREKDWGVRVRKEGRGSGGANLQHVQNPPSTTLPARAPVHNFPLPDQLIAISND